MIKTIFFITFYATAIFAQEYLHPKTSDPGFLGESKQFMFYSHLEFNMHHFLYNAAILYRDSGITAAVDSGIFATMLDEEKKLTESALTFYAKNMIGHDLRTGDYNFALKRWLVEHHWKNDLPAVKEFTDHSVILNAFKRVYSKFFWEKHHASNFKAYLENIDRIKQYESEFIARLTTLSQSTWTSEKIRVDISYHSKRDIPYTTTHPVTHIVMDSKRSNTSPGVWFELLLHEASHHLIEPSSGFVGGTIVNVCDSLGRKPPSQLWHAYLFYFSGKIAQEILVEDSLTNYSMYMIRYNVFSEYIPLLDQYLSAYMVGQKNLKEVTERIIEDYYKN